MVVNASSSRTDRDSIIRIEPLRAEDVDAADRVVRLAFGTFLGVPVPQTFAGDAECARTRWTANPSHAFAGKAGDEVIGSVFAARWGSVGFFGPLTVRPDYWDRGVGQRLLHPVMALFDRWATKHAGLYTFAHSMKHLGLYQKFGFRPRFLTMIMERPIGNSRTLPSQAWVFSRANPGDRSRCLDDCLGICDAIYEGLDVSGEIESVAAQRLGDTVFIGKRDRIEGLAVCHVGPGTEAGSGTCYVKFGAVRPGRPAKAVFESLLEACAALGASQGATRLLAGVNTARQEAYELLLAHGFRTAVQGVTMHRPNEPGYSRRGVYLLDDWR